MTWVVTAVVVASAAVSAKAQREAGKQEQFNLERQAEQEKIAAEGQELARRQDLNDALARARVSASVSGITGEGTPESIGLASARNIASSEGAAALSQRLRQSQLLREGKFAASTGRTQAASTLLKAGSTVASSGAFDGSGGG